MPLVIECASCGKKAKVRDELAGKKIKCPCGSVISVPAAKAPSPQPRAKLTPAPKPAKPSPRPPVDEDDVEVLPDASAEQDDQPVAYEFWKCNNFGTKLLVLDDDGVWHAGPNEKEYKRIKRDLQDGVKPEEALGDKGKFIPFSEVTQIFTNLKTRDLEIKYKPKDEETSETWTFDDTDLRDDAIDALRHRLGSDFRYQRRNLTRMQAAGAPLITILALVGLTAFAVFMAWALNQPSESNRRVRTNLIGLVFLYTVGFLGPIGTGAIGGLCIVVAGIWMVVRVGDPPIEVTLKPRGDDDEDEPRPKKKKKRRPKDDE